MDGILDHTLLSDAEREREAPTPAAPIPPAQQSQPTAQESKAEQPASPEAATQDWLDSDQTGWINRTKLDIVRKEGRLPSDDPQRLMTANDAASLDYQFGGGFSQGWDRLKQARELAAAKEVTNTEALKRHVEEAGYDDSTEDGREKKREAIQQAFDFSGQEDLETLYERKKRRDDLLTADDKLDIRKRRLENVRDVFGKIYEAKRSQYNDYNLVDFFKKENGLKGQVAWDDVRAYLAGRAPTEMDERSTQLYAWIESAVLDEGAKMGFLSGNDAETAPGHHDKPRYIKGQGIVKDTWDELDFAVSKKATEEHVEDLKDKLRFLIRDADRYSVAPGAKPAGPFDGFGTGGLRPSDEKGFDGVSYQRLLKLLDNPRLRDLDDEKSQKFLSAVSEALGEQYDLRVTGRNIGEIIYDATARGVGDLGNMVSDFGNFLRNMGSYAKEDGEYGRVKERIDARKDELAALYPSATKPFGTKATIDPETGKKIADGTNYAIWATESFFNLLPQLAAQAAFQYATAGLGNLALAGRAGQAMTAAERIAAARRINTVMSFVQPAVLNTADVTSQIYDELKARGKLRGQDESNARDIAEAVVFSTLYTGLDTVDPIRRQLAKAGTAWSVRTGRKTLEQAVETGLRAAADEGILGSWWYSPDKIGLNLWNGAKKAGAAFGQEALTEGGQQVVSDLWNLERNHAIGFRSNNEDDWDYVAAGLSILEQGIAAGISAGVGGTVATIREYGRQKNGLTKAEKWAVDHARVQPMLEMMRDAFADADFAKLSARDKYAIYTLFSTANVQLDNRRQIQLLRGLLDPNRLSSNDAEGMLRSDRRKLETRLRQREENEAKLQEQRDEILASLEGEAKGWAEMFLRARPALPGDADLSARSPSTRMDQIERSYGEIVGNVDRGTPERGTQRTWGEDNDPDSNHEFRFTEYQTQDGGFRIELWNAVDGRKIQGFQYTFELGVDGVTEDEVRRRAVEASQNLSKAYDLLREFDDTYLGTVNDYLTKTGRANAKGRFVSTEEEIVAALKNKASAETLQAVRAAFRNGDNAFTARLEDGTAIEFVVRERFDDLATLVGSLDHETFHGSFINFVTAKMGDAKLVSDALSVKDAKGREIFGVDVRTVKDSDGNERIVYIERGTGPNKRTELDPRLVRRGLQVVLLGADVTDSGRTRDWRDVTNDELRMAEEEYAYAAESLPVTASESRGPNAAYWVRHPFRMRRYRAYKSAHPELSALLGDFVADRFGVSPDPDATAASFIAGVHAGGAEATPGVERANIEGGATESEPPGAAMFLLDELDARLQREEQARADELLRERTERRKKDSARRRAMVPRDERKREKTEAQNAARAQNERRRLVGRAEDARSSAEASRLAGIGERDAALGAALEQGRKNAEVDEMNEKANLLGQEQARAALEERDELQRQTEEEDARRRAAQEDVDRAALDAEREQELREGAMNARSAELAEDTRRIKREAEERRELSERAGEQELAEREAVAREQMMEEDEREEARQRARDEDEARAALEDSGVRSRGATAEESAAFDKGPTYHGKTGRYLYKTMRVVNGHLEFPMAGTGVAVPPGEWLIAEDESRIDPKTGKRRTPLVFGSSKIKRDGTVNRQKGEAAPFPGFHMGTNPYMAHIGLGGNASQKHFQNADYVWVAVDVPMARTDEYAQRVATEGKGDPDKAMRGVIPEGGMYWRKTNPNMKGKWGVAGAMKIVKVLSDAEVDEILDRELPDRVRMGRQGGGRFNAKTMQFEGQDLKNWNLEEEEAKFNRAEAIKAVRKALASQFKDDAGNVYPTRYSRHLGRAISKETDDTIDLLSIGVPMTAEEIEARCPEWADAKRAAQKVEADIRDLFGVFPTSEIDTPERNGLNDAIVEIGLSKRIVKEVDIPAINARMTLNEALKRGESYKVRQDRIAVVVIGLPSAGKSSVFVKDVSRALQARVPDNDYVKPVYEEFRNGLGGNAVHQESADTNLRILTAARDRGDNIVYPILGYKPEKLQEVLDFFKEEGYSVHLLYNELPVPKAVARLLTRYLDNGRYLPLEQTIFKAAGKVGPAYEEKKHDFDSYAKYSNDVPIGAKPKRIEQSENSILGEIPGYGEVRDGRLGRRPGVSERSGVLEGSGPQVQSSGSQRGASEDSGVRSRGGSVEPAGRQKQAGVAYPDASAEIAKIPDGHFATVRSRGRGEFEEILKKKRPDLDAKATVKNIFALKTPKERKIALHWIVRGGLALPEDAYKVADALSVAEKAKVDPFRYKSPDELLLANKDFKPSARPIDPDTEQALTDKRDEGDGIMSYLVEESKFGQLTMRRIIDTHWGEDANPWCLLARTSSVPFPVPRASDPENENVQRAAYNWLVYDNRVEYRRLLARFTDGEALLREAARLYVEKEQAEYQEEYQKALAEQKREDALGVSLDSAWRWWQNYSALPKRVAFKDGRLLAFMATDEYDPESDNIFGGELMERTPPGRWREWDEWLRTEEGRENQASFAEWMQVNHPDEYAKALAYEQWWDRTDTSHPNLDWARGSDVRSRGGELTRPVLQQRAGEETGGGGAPVGRFGMKPGYDGSLTIETDPDGPDKELHAEIKRKARGLLDILRGDPLPSQVDPKLPPQYVLIAPLYKTDIQNAEQDAAMQELAGADYVGRYEEIARLCGTEFDYQSGRGIFQNQREISGRVGLGRVPTDVANLVASLFADVGAVQQQNSAIRYTRISKEEFDAIENPWEKARVVTLKYDASKFNLQQISDELQDVGFDATPYGNGEVLILKPMGEFYDDDGNYSPEKEEKFEIDFRNAYDILKGKGAIHDFEFEYASENYLDGEARRVLYLARGEEERRPALGREALGGRQGGVGALQEVRPGSSVREDSAEVKSRGGEITPAEDSAYMDAVQRGDMESVERLVRQAAAEAMPNTKVVDKKGRPLVVFHGTVSRDRFLEFKGGPIFAFHREDLADQYTSPRRGMWVSPSQTGRVMPLFMNLENPLEIDAERRLWRNLRVDWSETPVTTDDVIKYAREHGHDGVIIRHVRDNMFDNDKTAADEYIAFSSSQVKETGATYESRDIGFGRKGEKIDDMFGPTYDDLGSVIPLSQRFNPESNDIRSRGGDGLFADEIYGLRTRDVVERIKAENPSYVYRPEKRKIVEMVERGFAKAKADPKFYRDTVAAALAGKFSLDTDSQACLMLDEFLRSEAARKARANVIRLRSTGATAEEVAAAQAEADARAAAHEAVADAYMKFGKALSDGMNQRKAALDPETGSFAGLVQDFEGRAGDGAHATRDELVAIRRSWDEIRTMRDALRSILDQVADGGADAAIRALMELEAEGIRKSKGAIGRRPTIGEEEKVPSTDDEIAKWAKDRLVGAKFDPNDVETKLALRSIVRKIGRFLLQREMDAGRPLARPEEFRRQLGTLCRRIFSEVDETFNDWSDRTWGDVYSSYGVFTPATKDELARRQTQMTELQRLVSQLQDVEEEQKRPLRTGEQRVESSELAQDLRARIHSLMKELDLPIPEGEDAAKYLKTPLDTVKRAMQRRIDLLQRAIDEHKAVERNLDPVPYDDEALGLKERLEALRTQYELTFPKDEKELTYEERVERLLKGLKNRESKLMAELMDAQQGAFRGRRQDANGLARLNSKVVEARERVAAIREMIGQLEDAAGEKAYYSAESKAIRRLVNAKLRRLSEVNGWIRNPTKWEEQTAKETLDVTDRPQVKAAQAQLDAAIEKWEQVRDQLVWDRQNALSKGLKYAFGLFQVAKRWKAAADLSAVGVQGAVAGFLYDPRIGLDAIWKAVFKRKGEGGYAFSKEACDAIMQHMMDSPRWKVLVEKAGVRISSIDSVDFAKAEELRAEGYAAKRMESLVNKATGGVFGAVTKFGDRTYTMPLDIIRWSFANSLLDQLARVHGGVEAIPEADLKMLGRIVNIESGAGDLFQRLGFAGINRIIWAPGKLAGQLQSLALPVILAANLGKSGGISAKAAMLFFRKCWMRPLAMYGLFLLFYRMLAHLLGDDDHRDEIGEFIDTDPHSPWFGRVNIGGRRFSISAGLESYISLIYRTKDKERSDIYGSTRKVPTASDLITNMLWNKASPDVGIFRQVINGKTIDGRELETAGDKLKFMVGEVFWPLTMHDMYRTATSDTRFMPKLALLGLSAIGYSSNDFDYDSRKLDVSRFDQLTKLTKEDQKVFANKKGEYSAEEVEAARSRMQAYRNDEKYGKYARDYARGLELRERLRAIDNEIKKAEKKYGSNKKGLEADAEYQQLLEYKERTLTAFHRLYTPEFQADLPAFYDRYRPAR